MQDVFEPLAFAGRSLAIGIGATAILDLWALYAAKAYRVRGLDFGLLGRWVGHLAKGRFRHEAIASSPPVAGERFLGWTAHYAIGVIFAAALLVLCGPEWARHPTPGPALAFGAASVIFPFLILQPGMGAGLAASKTPDPLAARLRSLGSHIAFGGGLYLTARALLL